MIFGFSERKASDAARWSPEALKALGRLDFIAREILDGVEHGLHHSLRRGFSSEFFDYKSYGFGDDAAKIDWRLYAKTGKFFVKRFEAETSLDCMILADLSPSMLWRWRDSLSKREWAAMLAASLALLFVMQRDHVGLHSFGSASQVHLPPKSSTPHLESIFAALDSGACAPGGPGLLETASSLGSIKLHKGLVILLSDLEIPETELRESLRLLKAKGDEMIVFHILDKAEVELPFSSATHLCDSETGELLHCDLPALKASHAKAVSAFRDFARRECMSLDSVYVPLDTSSSCVEAILSMCRERKARI